MDEAHTFSSNVPCVYSEHRLELLHWKAANCLRSRLRLEHTRLLCEGVDALACLRGRLVLQLHVEHARDLEGTCFLHLLNSYAHERIHDTLHVLSLQACSLGHRL